MKKSIISFRIILCLQLLVLANNFIYGQTKKHANKKVSSASTNNYTGSYYKGNYVWGGAMNLAWNDFIEKIIKDKIQLATIDKNAIGMVKKLNNPPFTIADLDDKSYYIKSGFGQRTVEQINKESNAKFPQKSFPDLNEIIGDNDIIAYAYFFKKVNYRSSLTPIETYFKGLKVAGFFVDVKDDRGNIQIIEYINDDKFIVSITLKDSSDQLVLAKGYDMNNPEIVVNTIRQKINGYHESIEYRDTFEAPKLNLDYHRDYLELLGKSLANKGFEKHQIKKMYENIKFNLDEKGAKVEDEAVLDAIPTAIDEHPQVPKQLKFNKPFWVIMKRTESKNPYFILGVNNTALMNIVKK